MTKKIMAIEKTLCMVLALRRELQELYDLTKIPTKALREELARREKEKKG